MNLYKIMWVPATKKVIWDIKTEKQIGLTAQPYTDIEREGFNLYEWITNYKSLYRQWLKEDIQNIFDINHETNKKMVNLVHLLNTKNNCYKLLFWLDVNRYVHPDFEWKLCPIGGTKLKKFDQPFPSVNKNYSNSYPIVMPE